MIALLSVTGLRISEALKLTVADVTRDGLLIRETKFRKTRLAPLHDTAVAGLKRYLAHRRPRSEADPIFVDARGLPLRYIAVKETFDRLVGRAGIVPAAKRRPHLHDLCVACEGLRIVMSSIMRWRSGFVVAIGASCPETG